jgi:hypothetical protein
MGELNEKNKKRMIYMGVLIGCVALGFVLGYWVKPTKKVLSTQAIRSHAKKYTFISPLLAVNRADIDTPSPIYTALDTSVKKYITDQTSSGGASDVSVYFINYGKSGSFALDENKAYSPASLLKVVVMVAYLKQSDTDPSILTRRLTYNPSIAQTSQSVPFEAPSMLVVGRAYTVEDLINKMIIDSDNGAMNLLLDNADSKYLNDFYTELGVHGPVEGSSASLYTISATDYSLFFRILYNGTYLSDDTSEKALSILSKSTYADGLIAGLPAGSLVAHKYGEHVNGTADHIDSVELHDCGIAYVKNGPYLLCVMTKGTSLPGLQATIAHISKMIYDDVSTK